MVMNGASYGLYVYKEAVVTGKGYLSERGKP